MNKTDRLALCIIAAVFLAIAVFCIVLATSHAPAQGPSEPQPLVITEPSPPAPFEPDPDDGPAVEQPEQPEKPAKQPSPACGKECGGFGMDRPNCVAADCHCGDHCPCDETARCCPECLC